jgi:hypothetical protein
MGIGLSVCRRLSQRMAAILRRKNVETGALFPFHFADGRGDKG